MIETLADKIIFGIVAHLVADWLLQNDWMARNKHKPGAASVVHAAIHGILLIPVFEWYNPAFMFGTSTLVMLSHMIIDYRLPLDLWRRFYRQTSEGDIALHVQIWADQTLHIAIIALAASLEEVLM